MTRTRFLPNIKLLVDLTVWGALAPLALLIRFDFSIPAQHTQAIWIYAGLVLIIKAAALLLFRVNAQSWSQIAFRDVIALAKSVAVALPLQVALVYALRPSYVVPVSVPLIESALALLLLFFARALRRWQRERVPASSAHRSKRVLIVGAGEAGSMLVREMLRHPEMRLTPVGFLDDDPSKWKLRIAGVPVIGPRSDLKAALNASGAVQVLVATPSVGGNLVRETVRVVNEFNTERGQRVEIQVVPGVYELLSGSVSISRIRTVEVEDLLGRPPVQLDLALIREYIEGKVVLVTGAGGSIGSELARQLMAFKPAKMVLLGRGESSVFTIHRELLSLNVGPTCEVVPVIASVTNQARLKEVFQEHRPQVVFHAAAHKHVPLMEASPTEAVSNNILGSQNLFETALDYGVERLVNISTDKAVNPTNVMGATKRFVEKLVYKYGSHAQTRDSDASRFVSVRFGNVLGSRGSVIPTFKSQIESGGPVTLTDRRMTRYFMTIPEAVQLVLQAGAFAENGATYILDMGEPVKIHDLAFDLIRLSGFEPYKDIDIVETGMRPGEKLYEELSLPIEDRDESVFEKIFVARASGAGDVASDEAINAFRAAVRDGDHATVRWLLEVHGDLQTLKDEPQPA